MVEAGSSASQIAASAGKSQRMVRHAYVSYRCAGRVRLRIPSARHDAESLKRMAHAVREMPGVRATEYNPTTGSLLIKFVAGAVHNIRALADAISKAGVPLEVAGSLMGEGEIAELGEYSQAASGISALFQDLDDAIRYATDNQIDLKIMLPIGAVVLALAALRNPAMSTPLRLTLMLFSFSSYHALHGDMGERSSADPKVTNRYLH